MMRKAGNLHATVGEWTGDDGKKHKRRIRVGVVMRDDTSGKMAIKIEAIPVSPAWQGWLSISEGDDNDTS